MTIRYKTTDLSTAIEYMRIHLRDKYFVSAYKRGIEYIVQISGVEEVKDIADTPQTDCEKEKSEKSLCNSCIKDCDNRKRNLYTAECNRYEPQTDCGWK